MNRQIKIGMAMVVVLSALAYLIYVGIQTGSMYFLSVSEFTAQRLQIGDKNIRINGNVLPGSVKFKIDSLDLSFTLQDERQRRHWMSNIVVPNLILLNRQVLALWLRVVLTVTKISSLHITFW